MSEETSKATARIDRELYTEIQEHFHSGQQQKFLTCIYNSLLKKIKENKFSEVLDYMYMDKPLMLD